MIDGAARILAIETSSRWGSAAIGTPAGVIENRELSGEMRHAADFAALVDAMLKAQNWPARSIAYVLISVGPGSFTGLRIGVTMARTLSWSIGARIVAVPTLDAIARNALAAQPAPQNLAVLLDAKREQVYAGAYRIEQQEIQRLIEPSLEKPLAFLSQLPRPLFVMGEGVPHHREEIEKAGVEFLPDSLARPDARQVFTIGLQMARAGLHTPPGDLLPLYIRRPEAEEKWEKLHPPPGK